MFERFTERARQVVVLAQEEARTLKHNYIGTEHILLGSAARGGGPGGARARGPRDHGRGGPRPGHPHRGSGEEVTSGQIPFTPRAKKVLELALREALSLGHNYIGTEHILLGLVRENEGVAARILADFDADSEKIRNEIIRMLSGPGRRQQGAGQGVGQSGDKKSSKLLDQFGRNLTKLAAEGKLDPVVGPPERDRAGHADPLAAHQEQPGPDRRARRGQDRRHRGPGAAHLRATRSRSCCATSRSTRSTWPPWSPARSTAASSRSA